jgi:hypothetical protein
VAQIVYFDTLALAAGSTQDWTAYSDLITFGAETKNDGGGAHYKRYAAAPQYLGFQTAAVGSAATSWGLIPDNGAVNPIQSRKPTDGEKTQKCINFIQWWNDATGENLTAGPAVGKDSNRSAIKLVIPANHIFTINMTAANAKGLLIQSPITIEGEDPVTSKIEMLEDLITPSPTPTPTPAASIDGDGLDAPALPGSGNLFLVQGPDSSTPNVPVRTRNITFRNLTLMGAYRGNKKYGKASLLVLNNVDGVILENVTFTQNGAVLIGGDGVRNLVMRRCVLSESRRGGMVLSGAANITVEDNDFRWIPDDPIAINASGPKDFHDTWYFNYGGAIRIVGNRAFGCRGLNVVGAKNVLIEGNILIFSRGRAIHVGTVTDQEKGDTTALNIIIRANLILDLLDATVDPRFRDEAIGGHRAIDIELLYATPTATGGAIPGLPGGPTFVDPTTLYYTRLQGVQGYRVWQPGLEVPNPKQSDPSNPSQYFFRDKTWWEGRRYQATTTGETGTNPPVHTSGAPTDGGVKWKLLDWQAPTPHSGNILVEGNIIARTRAPISDFNDYDVGPYGGDSWSLTETIDITTDDLTPREGISVMGSARAVTIRGNQVRNCGTAISFEGIRANLPLSLLDIVIESNDLFDWTIAGIRFYNFNLYPNGTATKVPQRVLILNNRCEGDPFFKHPERRPGGKWNNATEGSFINVATGQTGVPGIGLLTIVGNHVRNVSQLIAGLDELLHLMRDNVGYCDPTNIRYDLNNVGIGNVIEPTKGWHYVIEYGDPTQLNCGQLINVCPLGASAMPTSGKWVQGMIVTNLTPNTGSVIAGGVTLRWEVSGWRCMKTGETTSASDWREQRVMIP